MHTTNFNNFHPSYPPPLDWCGPVDFGSVKQMAGGPVESPFSSRVAGLDTIRLGAAAIVAMSHGMLIPPQIYLEQGTRLTFWSGQIGHLLASGTGAVALFFVVSGLCIHLGREAAEHNPILFLVRRMVRIGLPLLSILVIVDFAGSEATELEKAVLWSVYCEIAYYLTYPLLLAAIRRWPLNKIFFAAVAASVALLIILPARPLIWWYGYWTPLICYPLWLAGAMLADASRSIAPCRTERLWHWRIGLVLAAAICSLVRHLPWATNLSALTYVVIGLLAVPFLRREIAHAMVIAPSSFSERLGRASYSIYLVHRFPIHLVERMLIQSPQWIVASAQLGLVTVCSFGFYVLCEKPALNLARAIAFKPVSWKQTRSALWS